jgi:CubicO group peptidase (beta-lactamase class C family)
MTQTRRWAGWAATVVVAITLAGCTFSSPPAQSGGSSTSAAHRVDVDRIVRLLDVYFANDAATTNRLRNRRALLLSVDGKLVVERYWHSSATTTGNIMSVTKTIMSTLIGTAVDEGKLHGVNQTLDQLLPTYSPVMNRQVAAITLRQLLTMTSGLPADDDEYSAEVYRPGQDWVRNILAHGLSGPVGHFQYSNAGSHLLSAILSHATGRTTLDYGREKLFDPLGIRTRPAAEPVALPENINDYERAAFAWPTDPQGINLGNAYVKVTASDMAKLGQLWLQNGRWHNRQLVSAKWIKASRTDRVPTGDGVAGAYGYQVWLGTNGGQDAVMARGSGGQLIEIVPALGLVVTVLSDVDLVRPDVGTAETTSTSASSRASSRPPSTNPGHSCRPA